MSAGGKEKPEAAGAQLTVGAVRTALKETLGGKYTEEHIDKALHDIGMPQDGVFDFKKVLARAPLAISDLMESSQEDMMDVKWGELFSKVGLPMSEEEAKKVMSAAKVSFKAKMKTERPPDTTSLDSISEAGKEGSAMDLVAAKEAEEKELLKIIEELKVESDALSPPTDTSLDVNIPTKETKQ